MVSGYTPPAHHQSPRPFSSVKTTRGTEDSVDLQFSCFPIFLVSLLKISLLTCLLNYGALLQIIGIFFSRDRVSIVLVF